MTTLLYYAGMATDRRTEQIGLAISEDGSGFQRAEGGRPIVPIEPATAWKSVRTCNPTVVRFQDEWVMFYQGVGPDAAGQLTHVIARARSHNARQWVCDPRPILTFEHVRNACPALKDSVSGGVLEPSIVVTGDELQMYFVAYRGTYSDGTWLYHARSRNGEDWQIDPLWVLSGQQFGNYRLHYPQVRCAGTHKTIWFSLIHRDTRASAILRMTSDGANPWSDTTQLLPWYGGGVQVEPREVATVHLGGERTRGAARINQALNQWLYGGRNYFGYSHPHTIDSRLFYHAYHRNRQGQSWMDIGWCAHDGDQAGTHTVALRPSNALDTWDAFFVADPYVITI